MIETFFRPRNVAIIGASPNPEKVGNNILANLKKRFKGNLFPINPKHGNIEGIKAYSSIRDVDDKIDMAVIVIPAKAANKAVAECADAGIKNIVIISAGYRESGSEGIILENELKSIIKGKDVNVIGPNCIGLLDTNSGVDTIFSPQNRMERPKKGGISIISQSGAFGSAFIDWCSEHRIGISKFVSFGNRADIDESDLLEYFYNDKDTEQIVIYIEGPKDGRKMMETMSKVSRKKPVIVLKAGKSQNGAEAAASHTGSLAGAYEVFSAAMRQAGAIEAKNLNDLFDYTKVLSKQMPARGPRVGIITNGGGYGVLATDACIDNGMEMAELSPATVKKVKRAMPGFAPVHNPMDLIGDATKERFEAAVEACIKDKNIDIIIIFVWALSRTLDADLAESISKISEKSKKPIICGGLGSRYTNNMLMELEDAGIPTFPSPHRSMKAAKALVEYGKVKR